MPNRLQVYRTIALLFLLQPTYPLATEEEKACHVVLLPRVRSPEEFEEDFGEGLLAPLGAVVDDAARGLGEGVERLFAAVKVFGSRLAERVPVGVVVDLLHQIPGVLVPSRQVVVVAVAVRARRTLE